MTADEQILARINELSAPLSHRLGRKKIEPAIKAATGTRKSVKRGQLNLKLEKRLEGEAR